MALKTDRIYDGFEAETMKSHASFLNTIIDYISHPSTPNKNLNAAVSSVAAIFVFFCVPKNTRKIVHAFCLLVKQYPYV